MYSKKGVSPLIATVLLLAFAVSIATIIVQLEPFTGGCSIFSAQVSELDGKKRVCFNEELNQIELFLANDKYDIIGMKYSVEGERDAKNGDLELFIEKHNSHKIILPYEINRYGKPAVIKLIPSYDKGGSAVDCPLELELEFMMPCNAGQ